MHDATLSVHTLSADLQAVRFTAMAGPCEILFSALNASESRALGELAAQETWRIEQKYSRYRDDSVVAWILRNRGTSVVVDEETASLLEFARHCYSISGGLFDVTSGVLRRAWTFDGSDQVPDSALITALLPFVGFEHLHWQPPCLKLPDDMELDFGGIGKEYAVDRVYDLLAERSSIPFLVNFGGDLRANRPPAHDDWQVGIEQPDSEGTAKTVLNVRQGAIATSGDARRFVKKGDRRYGHILDPRTGWPVPNAPRSVTVAASSCTEAGLLATIGMLKGRDAEAFLHQQELKFWVIR